MGPAAKRLTLSTPIRNLEWIGSARLRGLDRLKCETVGDILERYPKRYEDRRQFDRFPTAESDTPLCVCGMVTKTQLRHLRARQRLFDAVLEEADAHVLSTSLVCRWFNSPWVEKVIVQGQRLVVYGKPKRSGANIVIAHPEFEVVEDDAEEWVHLNRLTPIHRATEGLSARMMRRLVWDLIQQLDMTSVPTIVPKSLDRTDRAWALRQIHFPDDAVSLEKAQRHLVVEEFFLMQLLVASKRAESAAQPGAAHCGRGDLMRRLHASLPFSLTGAQRRAIDEIRADLASSHPMNRLLHGDVGSGKTLVALSAMLLCAESGHQAALMAPTQILAEQHYLNIRRQCEPLGLRVALRTGTRREETATTDLVLDSSTTTTAHILIGTHALLYEGAGFTRLGLAVIDEQHKFGVLQRARLREQGTTPDVLVMTATPIPRTLTMTVYGDLDVSTLDEMPKGRGKIITAVREEKKLPEAVKFIREHLEAGRQAYVVYPLIDESEKLEAKAAAAEFEKWRDLLAPNSCELLHGRVLPEEKDAIMERFRTGKTKVLIATTVIEVGIDVPNANLMLIENAERFGLAQLHQLRGRIGRGEHKSFCVLLTGAKADQAAKEKLAIFEKTTNGFEIAEHDLRIRGPGDILGTAQSGLPPLKIGDVFRDADLMKLARNAAFLLFERDPKLERPENRIYREGLAQTRRAILSQVS
jgi:ATP-dependent DNA helicase RecG